MKPPQAQFPHSATQPAVLLQLMGIVPSFPFAPAMIFYCNAGVGSSSHAAHGQLAQDTPLTAMPFFMASCSALFMSRSILPCGWTLAGASSQAAPDQKSGADTAMSVQDPGIQATGNGSADTK